MKNTQIVHVVAKDRQNCIGKDNDLAWHIPADLKHFKEITTRGVIVMGRKTFQSLGRPLPNRTHHVITRDTAWTADGVAVAHDLSTAINNAKADAVRLGKDRIFIIGGGEIYRQSLDMADFKQVWQSEPQIDEKSGIGFTFVRYEKSVWFLHEFGVMIDNFLFWQGIFMKHLSLLALLAVALTGCNAMTATADRAMNKQSSFSQEPSTRYPTVDEQKDSEQAKFGRQTFE